MNTALSAMPARIAIERGDWKGAAALPVWPTESPMAESLSRFTRGLGMARSGDLTGAKSEIAVMQTLRAKLEKSNNAFWADRTEEQMLAVSAWVALAEGNKENVINQLRLILTPLPQKGTIKPDLRIHAHKDIVIRPPHEPFHIVSGDHFTLYTHPHEVYEPIVDFLKQ